MTAAVPAAGRRAAPFRLRGPNVLGRHIWTEQEEEILRRGFADGDPLPVIAAKIGTTGRSVEGRARKLNLTHRSKSLSLQERFTKYVSVDKASGCHLWTGAISSQGRPQIRSPSGSTALASHVALLLIGIDVPRGMCACHHCDTPLCVNTDHLFIGTRLENSQDCRAKGRLVQMPAARKGMLVSYDECLYGHPMSGENLYVSPAGQRFCRRCRADRAREFRSRQGIAA